MMPANVMLSESELMLAQDEEIILTKNKIIDKAYALFGLVHAGAEALLQQKRDELPAVLFSRSAKIYKGEKYKGLPYVLYDYPRIFSPVDTCAIRCMFLWGKFLSITLHLSGSSLQRCRQSIGKTMNNLPGNWYICVNEDAWQHDFEETNYIPLHQLTGKQMQEITGRSFFKIATKTGIDEWSTAPVFFEQHYACLLNTILTTAV